jgi:hypothetical protein
MGFINVQGAKKEHLCLYEKKLTSVFVIYIIDFCAAQEYTDIIEKIGGICHV